MGHLVHKPMVDLRFTIRFITPAKQKKKIAIIGSRAMAKAKIAKELGSIMIAV
jgi:hypothetical protein